MSRTAVKQRQQWEYFEPNSWAQQRAIQSPITEVLYSGRLGSSKSRTLGEKADERCSLYPGASVAITRRYQTDLYNTTLNTFFRDVVSPAMKQEGWRPSHPGGSTFFYPEVNGKQSSILCAGLDRPGRLNSGEFDLILVDQAEEVTEDQWDVCAGRLRHRHGPYQQIAGFCNPDGPAHFLYKRFRPDLGSHIQRLKEDRLLPNGVTMRKGTPFREVILAGRTDNLENLTDKYLLTISNYRGVTYQRMALGMWVMPIGIVYPMYDPNVHVIGTPASWARWGGYPPPDWTRFCGIDLGFDNPFVCVWFAESPDGVLYVYREHYMTNRTVPRHAKTIIEAEEDELAMLRRCAKLAGPDTERQYASWLNRLNITDRFCDHDRGEREQLDEAFDRARTVPTSMAEKDIAAGLQSVAHRLESVVMDAQLDKPMVVPRIFFVRDCLIEEDPVLVGGEKPISLFDEFPRYRWPKRRSSSEDVGDSKFDKPVDQDNHGMDAIRYGVHSWDRGREVAVY